MFFTFNSLEKQFFKQPIKINFSFCSSAIENMVVLLLTTLGCMIYCMRFQNIAHTHMEIKEMDKQQNGRLS